MKHVWIPALLASALSTSLAVAATSATPSPETPPAEDKGLEVGSTVPASITLKDFEGKALSFEKLRGKVTVVHFWSDRCPAERHANPIFKKMEEQYAANADVVMIGIASNQNELGPKPGEGDDFSEFYGDLRKKRDEVGYRHTILADHGNVVSDLFQARSTPHCYVLDQKGVIRYAGALDDDPRGSKGDEATNYVANAVSAILAGRELEVTETKPYG